jgi:hypothetical protein
MTLPFTIEIAWTVAAALPMYATPSETTAGRSARPSAPPRPCGTAAAADVRLALRPMPTAAP